MSTFVELSSELSRFVSTLRDQPEIRIGQRLELAEFFGFETRNKYAIHAPGGQPLGFAAEQGKGILGHLSRYFLGHWRRFEIHFFNSERQLMLRTCHPFRFLFQRLEIMNAEGQLIGALQQRFGIITKKFDVLDARDQVLLEMRSPLLKFWTFPFKNAQGQEVARIEKHWSGLLNEAFTDKDQFRIVIRPELEDTLVPLILAAGLFVDIQYFEKKANG